MKNELNILENIEKLKELTGSSYWALNSDENSIMSAIGLVRANISKSSANGQHLNAIEENLISASEA